MASLELFVPGRLAILGEHSDWAGEHRAANKGITPGRCLVCTTNQGLYARVEAQQHGVVDGGGLDPEEHALAGQQFAMVSTAPDGAKTELTMPLEPQQLLELASAGGFFSYVAGVAHIVTERFGGQIGGLRIDQYRTTLPTSKGLSSSAAVCVLVARAFNRVYGLGLTPREEMDIAYEGEILTPSKCGRMDQCVAFGHRPVLMTFDGDHLQTEVLELPKGAAFHWLIIDLAGQKSTSRILEGLQAGYPQLNGGAEAQAVQTGVRDLLGPTNERIVGAACAALRSGDAPAMGRLMVEAQREFDAKAMPACPSELTSPKLHALLALEAVAENGWGAKGVGSQGDGTAQVLCKSEAAREQVIAAIQSAFPEMECIPLTLQHSAARMPSVIVDAAVAGGDRSLLGIDEEFGALLNRSSFSDSLRASSSSVCSDSSDQSASLRGMRCSM